MCKSPIGKRIKNISINIKDLEIIERDTIFIVSKKIYENINIVSHHY